jgi:hypothetical protein
MTKREMFVAIANVVENEEYKDFLLKEAERLANRSANRKPTAKQIANVGLVDEIRQVLGEAEAPMTIKEIIASLEGEYTSQKISALLRNMGDEVEKTYEKKVAYFKLA